MKVTKNDSIYEVIGRGEMMELLIENQEHVHVNSSGYGAITFKTCSPHVLYFSKEKLFKKDIENYQLLELLDLENEKLEVHKVRERLYDFTLPNKKVVEIHFDKTTPQISLDTFDEKLISLGLENNAVFEDCSSAEVKRSTVSEYIEKGGGLICKGIDVGSYLLGLGIMKGGKALKKRIKPIEQPSIADPKWEKRLSNVSSASSSAYESVANSFSYVIDKSVGKSMSSNNETLKSTARASLRVIESLSEAGEHLLTTAADTTTELIDHRYNAVEPISRDPYGPRNDESYESKKSVLKAFGSFTSKVGSTKKRFTDSGCYVKSANEKNIEDSNKIEVSPGTKTELNLTREA